MKPGIHPNNYRPVVFHDVAIDTRWIMMSTVETHETTVWEDGRTYPLYRVETSMYSHPFYTGTQRIVDAEGRVEKFNKKYRRPTPPERDQPERRTEKPDASKAWISPLTPATENK